MGKGCSYGTIGVDLDRRRIVDLLPDLTAATLAAWLEQRPGIRVVARALRVADRWHLLANMRQAVERKWLPAGSRSSSSVPRRWPTREHARGELFACIEGYDNRRRIHSAPGYRTPEQAEQQMA